MDVLVYSVPLILLAVQQRICQHVFFNFSIFYISVIYYTYRAILFNKSECAATGAKKKKERNHRRIARAFQLDIYSRELLATGIDCLPAEVVIHLSSCVIAIRAAAASSTASHTI
jgi:hypothetical protein